MDGNSPALQAAMAALRLWSGARQNLLVPFGTSASSVFGVRVRGATHFLRLTSRSFRSTDDATDELSFLHHLCSHGVHVAMPVPSNHGENVEKVGDFLATLFRRAPGLRVTPEARLWNRTFLREWGRALAFQHQAAHSFRNPSSGRNWRQEPVLVEGLKHIQANERYSRVASIPFLLNWTCKPVSSAKLVRSMPISHHKIFVTIPNLVLRRSTSTTAVDIGFCMTSQSRCRFCASDRNVSN
jgi:Ser/Thr protein kinase RdoA (MazF antagonist)